MRGYYRRSRSQYEAARITSFMVAKTMGGSKAMTFQDFMPFSWEADEIAEQQKRDIEASRQLLEQFQKEYEATHKNVQTK